MLLSILSTILLRNLLTCKGTVSPSEGRFRADDGTADEHI